MATTRWLDNVNGDDASTGANPTNSPPGTGPKLTWDAAILQVTAKGDVMNVINTGTTYTVTTPRNIGGGAGSALPGTSYSDFGCKIQGVDVDGNPSMVKLRHGALTQLFGVRDGQHYVIIQGFHCDRTLAGLVNNALTFVVMLDNAAAGTTGPVRLQYCIDESDATHNGAMVSQTALANSGSSVEVQYCLLKNWGVNGGVTASAALGGTVLFHHNVLYRDIAGSPPAAVTLGTDDNRSNTDHEMHNNTMICAAGRMNFLISNGTHTTGAHANAKKYCHSNVFVQFGSPAGTDSYMAGSATWDGFAWTGTRLLGYSLFVDTTGFDWTVATGHPYQVPWDPDDTDGGGDVTSYWPTDVTDSVDPFNDSATAWDWDVGGYVIPLVGDYRLPSRRTMAQDGGVPGAIADVINVPSDPPDGPPGDAGLPVGPEAPAFLFTPDGLTTAVRVLRNTVLEGNFQMVGAQEQITHAGVAAVVLATNVVASPMPLLANSKLFMLQTDSRVTVQVNSQTVLLNPGGCMLLDGANLVTFKVTNASTVRQPVLRYVGAN